MSPELPRVALLWCPDWSVTAARAAAAQKLGLGPDAAVALIDKGLVCASSAAARAEGVIRGLRLREAQARHPDLVLLDYDPALDGRAFEPVIAAMEQLVPEVQLLRPGLCAVAIRGAARYYGGERAAGLFLASHAVDAGATTARVGIADGIFSAEQAAYRTAGEVVRIVPSGAAAAFLAPLGIGVLEPAAGSSTESAGMITLLRRLGIRTLGEFAALPADDVLARFGVLGARLHTLASGRDCLPLVPRTPPVDLDAVVVFEPPLERVDQVAFGVRAAAERFIEQVTAAKLVCTAIRVQLDTESAGNSERVWLHPHSFSAGDVVDRVRWQLQGAALIEAELHSGIARVRICPEAVDAIGNHESGLWGGGPDERIHHGLSRVQSMLGHEAVLVPSVTGGRTLSDRQQLVAWGDRPLRQRSVQQPWPGQLPAPLPATVFSPRRPVQVLSSSGEAVLVDDRGALSASPARLAAAAAGARTELRGLTAWAGPWPLEERWWSNEHRKVWRFQAVDDTGCAWLLVLEAGGWWAEGRYD